MLKNRKYLVFLLFIFLIIRSKDLGYYPKKKKKSTNYNKVSAKVIYCTTRPCFALMELVRYNLITITKSHCHDDCHHRDNVTL